MRGFFAELIRKIGVPAIEEQLLATVEAELAKNVPEGLRLMAFERVCAARRRARRTRRSASRSARYDVAVARDGDEVFAIHDICSHAAVALSEGEVDDCRSSAGCTARASTCAPASRPACPPPNRSPPSPIEVTRRRTSYVDTDHHPERSHPLMSTLEIHDLHVSVDTEDGPKEILKGVT